MVAILPSKITARQQTPAEHAQSYWAATAEIAPASPPLQEAVDTDVAVIGAGYTGLSTAHHLQARHGISATVVEAQRVGWGCSGRNGGFAMIGVGKDGYEGWIRRVGLDGAKEAFEFGRSAVRTLRNVLASNGIEAASDNEGYLYVAHKPNRVSELLSVQTQLKQYFDFDAEFLGADDLRRGYLDGAHLHGALHYPEHFPIHPMRYVQGLARAVRQQGVRIYENSPVIDWSKSGDYHVLRTPSGSLRARKVVIATNGYTPDTLHGAVQGKLMNVLSNIIVTEPLSEAQRAATNWMTHKMLVDTRNLRFYFRLLEDNRIMFGARGGIEDTSASRTRMQAWLLRQLTTQFPGLHAIRADYFWQGWVAIPRDKGPHLCLDDRGTVAYFLGCTGTGVAIATHAGKLLADALAAGRPLAVPRLVGSPLPAFELPALRKLYQRAAYAYFYLKDEYF